MRAFGLFVRAKLLILFEVQTSPGAFGYEPRPQDATPRSAFGSSPETAP